MPSFPNSVKIGIDLVEVAKVKRVLVKTPSLQEALFTPAELRCSIEPRFLFVYLAQRFAAKEAFLKALGTGLSGGTDWRDVEVQEVSGRPLLQLWGQTALVANEMRVVRSALSLSHTKQHAVALVVLVLSK